MTLTNRSPADLLPLPVAQFLILLALATGDKHGYAIMREVEVLTKGSVAMGPGTLYGTVKKMLKAALVEESAERPDPKLDDQRRRYYRITGLGGRVLDAEANRMEQLAVTARLIQTTATRESSA